MKNIHWAAVALAMFAASLTAAPLTVDVRGVGAEKKTVAIDVRNQAFARSLKNNLERSGLFRVGASGAIKVTGEPQSGVQVVGAGKSLTMPPAGGDDAATRMAARRLSDAMVGAYSAGTQKGFACDPIAFVKRVGRDNSELCACYPDGYDIRQLTSDARAVVGPRWKDANTLLYTNLRSGPEIWELDVRTGRRHCLWKMPGLATGATVSPDGRRVAIIMSFQGNPELYVIDIATKRWVRLTNTANASEGQPVWSPDGREIAYVSNETRHPQLYVIDVATKAKRRLTKTGSQNVDPDWGADGRLTYISKRGGGAQVMVMHPSRGDASAFAVTGVGNWEHPSWSRDGRNLVASRDNALYVVDTTLASGVVNAPQKVFSANGKWITPCWTK